MAERAFAREEIVSKACPVDALHGHGAMATDAL